MDKTYSVAEVAELLNVDESDIQICIDEGRLSCLRVGKRILITQTALDAFLSKSSILPTNLPTDLDNGSGSTVTSHQHKKREDDAGVRGNIVKLSGRKKPFMYQIYLGVDSNGKRIRYSKSFETRKEAEDAMRERIAELSSHSEDEPVEIESRPVGGRTLVADYMQYFLDLGTTNAKPRTLVGYYNMAKCISRNRVDGGLGDLELREIDDEVLLKFFNRIKSKYAQATLNKMYTVINLAFKYAYKKNYIQYDIMEDVKKPKSEMASKKIEAYTDEELDTILTAAKGYPEIYPILITLAETGMRPGELRALKWSNLNWDNRTIKIEGAITEKNSGIDMFGGVKDKKEILGGTKSSSGMRTVFLTSKVISALQEWKKYIDENPDFILARNDEYIFVTRAGGFIKRYALVSKFKRFLKSSGLEGKGVTLYRFRHTFCTKLIEKSVPLPYIKKLMGDSTTDVIINIYSTVTDSSLRSKIDEVFE